MSEHTARLNAARTNTHRDVSFVEILDELSTVMGLDDQDRKMVAELEAKKSLNDFINKERFLRSTLIIFKTCNIIGD